MVNVNEKRGAVPLGNSGEPLTPEAVVKRAVQRALRIHPVPENAVEEQPALRGKFELEMVGQFKNEKGEVTTGGGLVLHTGSEAECKQLFPIAFTILAAIGADVVQDLMALVERQIGNKKVLGDVAKQIVNPSGHSFRCQQCGKLKPCGCISAKRK